MHTSSAYEATIPMEFRTASEAKVGYGRSNDKGPYHYCPPAGGPGLRLDIIGRLCRPWPPEARL